MGDNLGMTRMSDILVHINSVAREAPQVFLNHGLVCVFIPARVNVSMATGAGAGGAVSQKETPRVGSYITRTCKAQDGLKKKSVNLFPAQIFVEASFERRKTSS